MTTITFCQAYFAFIILLYVLESKPLRGSKLLVINTDPTTYVNDLSHLSLGSLGLNMGYRDTWSNIVNSTTLMHVINARMDEQEIVILTPKYLVNF